MKMMIKPVKYVCPKCGSKNYRTGTLWAARSVLAKIFDIQMLRYSTVTCIVCTYTELYNLPLKRLGEVLEYTTNKEL
jgi:predicted nucleic-acid-binding Zn-ribbon protein